MRSYSCIGLLRGGKSFSSGAGKYKLNKNTWGVKKCGANQKQHCKQAGVTKRFDIS